MRLTAADHALIIIVKVGTSSLMDAESNTFSLSNLGHLIDTVCRLKEEGHKVVLVSSGAVGAGLLHMKMKEKPKAVPAKQAVAAIGQCRLMRLYEDLFSIREQKTAQLLVTRTDLLEKAKYMNFKRALLELLTMDVIPIINENDSIATEYLRFGDNDSLAAYCAVCINASWVFLLTDVDTLYTSNPRNDPTAKPVIFVDNRHGIETVENTMLENSGGTLWGTGGMKTKIIAAKISTATGIHTALCNGEHPERMIDMIRFGESHQATHETHHHHHSWKEPIFPRFPINMSFPQDVPVEMHQLGIATVKSLKDPSLPYIGTIFSAKQCTESIRDQRKWISSLPVRGTLIIDDGALNALQKQKSLLAVGVVAVQGHFIEGEAVSLMLAYRANNGAQHQLVQPHTQPQPQPQPQSQTTTQLPQPACMQQSHTEVGRCLVNYSAKDINKIKGLRSDCFHDLLGYDLGPEVADRHNIICTV